MNRLSKVRDSSTLLRQLIACIDILAIFVAGQLCLHWYPNAQHMPAAQDDFAVGNYLLLEALASVVMLSLAGRVYRMWRGGELSALLGRAVVSWVGTWALVLVWLVLTKSSADFSRIWLISWFVAALLLLCIGRTVVYFALRHLSSKNISHQTVLLIGESYLSAQISQRAKYSSWTGFDVIGCLRPNNIEEIDRCVERYQPDEIWIGLELTDQATLKGLLHVLRHSTANIRLMPDLYTLEMMNHGTSMVMGYPMLDISHSPMHGLNVILKSIFDFIFATFVLLLIWPVLLAIAIAVKLDSPGPIFFKQKRHGWNGKLINVYKFRSMVVHQEGDHTVTQASRNDRRITKLGAFLRRTSLDELPQFINVLQGRLSVVGPRPHAVAHNEQYKELVPRYMLRHKVKPGITGWAQINGFRGETDTIDKMENRIKYDIHYIENWSLLLDCYIIFMTIFKGFINKNAY